MKTADAPPVALAEFPEGAKLFLAATPSILTSDEYKRALYDARLEAESSGWDGLVRAAVAHQLHARLSAAGESEIAETGPVPRPATGGPEERAELRRGYHAELDQIDDQTARSNVSASEAVVARAQLVTARAVLHLAETLEALGEPPRPLGPVPGARTWTTRELVEALRIVRAQLGWIRDAMAGDYTNPEMLAKPLEAAIGICDRALGDEVRP